MDAQTWLLDWFERSTDVPRKELEVGLRENYLEKEWIDSFRFINLVADAEAAFRIRFRNDEFQNRQFATIGGMAEVIRERAAERGAPR